MPVLHSLRRNEKDNYNGINGNIYIKDLLEKSRDKSLTAKGDKSIEFEYYGSVSAKDSERHLPKINNGGIDDKK